MHIILDHISAVLVSAVMLIIFVLLQVRGTQSSTETTINYMIRSETLEISDMLERDLLNMRTATQTDEAAADSMLIGGSSFMCSTEVGIHPTSGDTTKTFTFPTLSDPQVAAGLSNPDSAEVTIVSYSLIREEGASISRMLGPVTLTHPLYRIERQVNGVARGMSQSTVTYFNIDFGKRDGTFQPATTSNCPTDMNRVRFQIQMARNGVEDTALDQRNTSQLNFSRYGGTVDLINWDL